MLQNVVFYMLTSQIGIAISQNLSGMAGFFQRHFAGTDNLRIVSIILLLLAFILFLFLVVILYIKSLMSFIKNDVSSSVSDSTADTRKISQDLENEKDMERALEKDLEKSRQQKQNEQLRQRTLMETERQRQLNAEKALEKKHKAAELQKLQKQQNLQNTIPFPTPTRGRASAMEFDWKKGRHGELDEVAAGIEPFQYSYTPDKKPLDSLVGLIVNMLGRDIDDGKIAQTVKSKSGDLAGEDDIIQLIGSIKSFISLSNNGKFDNLPDADELPSADEALYSLTQGDSGNCLTMMQALIDNNIDKGHLAKSTPKRDITFLETSNYACVFGTLASLHDLQLATGAFELAIELSPKNVNAWSRAGDMYARAGSDSRAIWAYQNVLDMGDADIYPHQTANANKHLSQYYYDQGDSKKAAKFYNSSNDYYATIGINEDLTPREHEIINIIESSQEANMPDTISKLLNLSAQRQRSYM